MLGFIPIFLPLETSNKISTTLIAFITLSTRIKYYILKLNRKTSTMNRWKYQKFLDSYNLFLNHYKAIKIKHRF